MAGGVPFIGPATNDPTRAGWLWTGREHLFRSTNYGRNPVMTKEQHQEHCNLWKGDFDVDEDGDSDTNDVCDDWKPLGDPGVAGRLTDASFGATRTGGTVAAVEPARDGKTLWAATSTGRIFVSKNADAANPATVTFSTGSTTRRSADPPRYPTAIFVDPADANHAWITYSGFNAKPGTNPADPNTPGHVFEVRYIPGASTFVSRDGTGDGFVPRHPGDVDRRLRRDDRGRHRLRRGEERAVTARGRRQARASRTSVVADLVLVPGKKDMVYAGTHGQGVWTLKFK